MEEPRRGSGDRHFAEATRALAREAELDDELKSARARRA